MGWWVLAIIIAFANWKQIAESISNIIRNSLKPAPVEKAAVTAEVSEKAEAQS